MNFVTASVINYDLSTAIKESWKIQNTGWRGSYPEIALSEITHFKLGEHFFTRGELLRECYPEVLKEAMDNLYDYSYEKPLLEQWLKFEPYYKSRFI